MEAIKLTISVILHIRYSIRFTTTFIILVGVRCIQKQKLIINAKQTF